MDLAINVSQAIGDADGVIRVTTSFETAGPNLTEGDDKYLLHRLRS